MDKKKLTEYHNTYYHENKKELGEYLKNWRAANKEKVREINKKSRIKRKNELKNREKAMFAIKDICDNTSLDINDAYNKIVAIVNDVMNGGTE